MPEMTNEVLFKAIRRIKHRCNGLHTPGSYYYNTKQECSNALKNKDGYQAKKLLQNIADQADGSVVVWPEVELIAKEALT